MSNLQTIDVINQILIEEGVRHLKMAIRATELLWKHRPIKTSEGYTIVSHLEIPGALQRLTEEFGYASTLLFDDVDRSKESKTLKNLRSRRVTIVKSICSGIDLAQLTDRRVRNRLVHVDEHFPKLILGNAGSNILKDLAISDRGVIGPESKLNYYRVYIFNEDKLLHLGVEFDVKAAYEAAIAIIARFHPNNVPATPTPPLSPDRLEGLRPWPPGRTP